MNHAAMSLKPNARNRFSQFEAERAVVFGAGPLTFGGTCPLLLLPRVSLRHLLFRSRNAGKAFAKTKKNSCVLLQKQGA